MLGEVADAEMMPKMMIAPSLNDPSVDGQDGQVPGFWDAEPMQTFDNKPLKGIKREKEKRKSGLYQPRTPEKES